MRLDEPDYYAILGVDPTATDEEIRLRHRQLVRELHPDTHDGDAAYQEKLTLVNVAFNELKNELRRGAYDRRRREVSPDLSDVFGARPDRPAARPTPTAPQQTFKTSTKFNVAAPPKRVEPKRRNLLGALLAAGAAIVIIITMMVIANQSTPDEPLNQGSYEFSPVVTAAGTTAPAPANKSSQQYQAVEQVYLRHLNQIESDAEQTQIAVNQMEVALEDQGDSESAKKLQSDSINFDNRLLSADQDVHSLATLRDLGKERKLEMSLTNRFVGLQKSDEGLIKELQGIRSAALANNGTGPDQDDSQSKQPSSSTL